LHPIPLQTRSNNPLARMDLRLTYAMPVQVEKFGAHLEAYVATLSTITALRLCHRFGASPYAYINNLPVELLKQIEQHLIPPIR